MRAGEELTGPPTEYVQIGDPEVSLRAKASPLPDPMKTSCWKITGESLTALPDAEVHSGVPPVVEHALTSPVASPTTTTPADGSTAGEDGPGEPVRVATQTGAPVVAFRADTWPSA